MPFTGFRNGALHIGNQYRLVEGKCRGIRIAGRADHADDCSRDRRNNTRTVIDFDDLRAVVKITHPVNSVVSGRVLLSWLVW